MPFIQMIRHSQCLTHLAYLLRTQEKQAEARPLLERVLPTQEKRLGRSILMWRRL